MGVSRKSKPVKTTVSEPSSAIPMRRFLDSPWAPVLYFLVFAMVYFSGFVFSDSVLLGLDTGTDFHLGKEPFWEKAAELVPPNWSRHQGGTPQTGQRLMNYFPLHIISLFTSVHRYLGWRYFFAVFSAGYFAYLCIRGFGLRPATAILIGTAYASMPTLLTLVRGPSDL